MTNCGFISKCVFQTQYKKWFNQNLAIWCSTPLIPCACQHAIRSLAHARTNMFQNTLTIPPYLMYDFFLLPKNKYLLDEDLNLAEFGPLCRRKYVMQFNATLLIPNVWMESAWNRRYAWDGNLSEKYYAPNVLTSNSTNQLLQKFLYILAIVGFFLSWKCRHVWISVKWECSVCVHMPTYVF